MTKIKELFRSVSFNIAYWVISLLYVMLATISMIVPTRTELETKKRFFVVRWIALFMRGSHETVTSWIVGRYAYRMVQAMRYLAGIRLYVIGRDKVPEQCIIAAKHHSWFDGFSMMSQFDKPLSFVTGDHLERIPLLRGILYRLGAIVVNSCGGHETRKSLKENAAKAVARGQSILIYPEGHLSAPGTHHTYRTGVWHMYRDHKLPVVPVATNLGCFAQQERFWKKSGIATLQFMDPIPYDPEMTKVEFMSRLVETIEGQSDILISHAQGGRVIDSYLMDNQKEREQQAKRGKPFDRLNQLS